ncbi:hypothetical protein GCM10012275_00950 [Longimycelium tulufanense]|uniref:Uncharacterized protein n=1 Tax=Longimycelium tulufanense TaxID=907463 RepID=A0A8J3C5I7_9PSEU|nr:hypothetical protein [Longimycelium tulufanense]GGM33295.1 hypothetical protein GCM10012275_00950 [Longimycelium tulufanense]
MAAAVDIADAAVVGLPGGGVDADSNALTAFVATRDQLAEKMSVMVLVSPVREMLAVFPLFSERQ